MLAGWGCCLSPEPLGCGVAGSSVVLQTVGIPVMPSIPPAPQGPIAFWLLVQPGTETKQSEGCPLGEGALHPTEQGLSICALGQQ